MRSLFFFLLCFVFFSCNNSAPTGPVMDLSGYDVMDVPGQNLKKVAKKDEAGNLLESGFVENGVKTGTWTTYTTDGPFPQKIASYAQGNYNGIYMEFNERGQVEILANYKNNKLHGKWGKYRFGRPEETAVYKEGELHGTYAKYYTRDGKIQNTIEYKDGKQDGYYRFYNEEGEVTLEYMYRDGEKVEGGIVDPKQEAAQE
ncbi:MAG: hypothetical protein MRY78_00870 [Saprospiraceae bacterium]|nr:hypothetical protein [Saprospiraceae bacterium]